MIKTHREVRREALTDPEVRREYDALGAEFELRRVLLNFRRQMNMTQHEVAERLGTQQEYISRIERGHVDLTLSYLARLLHAMDADVEVSIRPRNGSEPISTIIPVS